MVQHGEGLGCLYRQLQGQAVGAFVPHMWLPGAHKKPPHKLPTAWTTTRTVNNPSPAVNTCNPNTQSHHPLHPLPPPPGPPTHTEHTLLAGLHMNPLHFLPEHPPSFSTLSPPTPCRLPLLFPT